MSNKNFNDFTHLNYNYRNIKESKYNEYVDKIKILENTLHVLIQLNNKRKIEEEKNKLKIKNEIEESLNELKKEMENHKKNMIDKIDNFFNEMQSNFIYVINNKKQVNANIYNQIEQFKNIIKTQIVKIKEESNNLNIKNKENIENIKEEFNSYIFILLILNNIYLIICSIYVKDIVMLMK